MEFVNLLVTNHKDKVDFLKKIKLNLSHLKPNFLKFHYHQFLNLMQYY